MQALPAIKADEDDEADEDAEETDAVVTAPADARMQAVDVLMAAMRNWSRALEEGRLTPGGQSRRVIEVIGTRMPPESEFMKIGQDIATRVRLRTLAQAPRTLVHGLPRLYASFRRKRYATGVTSEPVMTRAPSLPAIGSPWTKSTCSCSSRCVSAWNKDPAFGVIGIQSGPPH